MKVKVKVTKIFQRSHVFIYLNNLYLLEREGRTHNLNIHQKQLNGEAKRSGYLKCKGKEALLNQ